MHIHILGICGTFMGGVAALAREAGHRVTGCDANVYPPMSDQLRALGIDLIEGFGPEQLALGADLWVVGNVVSRGNPLMEAILDAGAPFVPLVSGPQVLGRDSSLRVRFAPTTAGEFDVAATLTITDADDGDATSTVVVHLRGRGVATSVGEASYYACNTSGGDGAGGAGLIVLAATLTMRRRRRATR